MSIAAEEVQTRLQAVVAAMKANGTWAVERPDDEAFEEMGPFGQRSMSFAQWLRWVFVPQVETLIATNGPWPDGSGVEVKAIREGDTDPEIAELIPVLHDFDALFLKQDEEDEEEDEEEDAKSAYEARYEDATNAYERSRALHAAGDTAGALKEIRATLGVNPDHPNAHNFAGWILVSQREPSNGDLEAAVTHFREARRREPNAPHVLPNLANTLRRLGRPDEAVTEAMKVAEAAGPLAGEAHNWLGLHFTREAYRDLPHAIEHLKAAIDVHPQWGTAWLNLARAYDAQNDAAHAYHAYGEAIACGNSHDDPTARGRQLALYINLRAQNIPPPPGSREPAATDRAALDIISALATAHPEIAQRQAFGVRPSQTLPQGESAFAMIFSTQPRPMLHTVVRDLHGLLHATTLTRRDDLITFRDAELPDGNTDEAVTHLADWLAAGGDANPEGVNPLDTGITIHTILTTNLPRPLGWRFSASADPHRPDRPATVTVTPIGAARWIIIEALPETGVHITLMPEAPEREPLAFNCRSPTEVTNALPRIVDSSRAALATWDAFRAHPLTARLVADTLRPVLARELGGRWTIDHDDNPRRNPDSLWLVQRSPQARWVIMLTDGPDACRVRIGTVAWALFSPASLETAVSDIVDTARAGLARVTLGDLQVGARFRVQAAFRGLASDETITVTDYQERPQGRYTFTNAFGTHLVLALDNEEDGQILDEIGDYLMRA